MGRALLPCMAGAVLVVVALAVASEARGQLDGIPHPPIHVTSDAELLLPTSGVVGGTGTAADPFVISGWLIDAGLPNPRAQAGTAIHITGTTFHIRIAQVALASRFEQALVAEGEGSLEVTGLRWEADGVALDARASRITLRSAVLVGDRGGARLEAGEVVVTASSFFGGSGVGLQVRSTGAFTGDGIVVDLAAVALDIEAKGSLIDQALLLAIRDTCMRVAGGTLDARAMLMEGCATGVRLETETATLGMAFLSQAGPVVVRTGQATVTGLTGVPSTVAVEVPAGARAKVSGMAIQGGRHGVLVQGGQAHVEGSTITGTTDAAVAVTAGTAYVQDSTLEDAAMGVRVEAGATATLRSSRILNTTGTGILALGEVEGHDLRIEGSGCWAVAGHARLERVIFSRNEPGDVATAEAGASCHKATQASPTTAPPTQRQTPAAGPTALVAAVLLAGHLRHRLPVRGQGRRHDASP